MPLKGTSKPRNSASRSRKATSKPAKTPGTKGFTGKTSKGKADQTAGAFVRGVLIRGEAAKPADDGTLPPGATHEIVEEKQVDLPKIKRRRTYLY